MTEFEKKLNEALNLVQAPGPKSYKWYTEIDGDFFQMHLVIDGLMARIGVGYQEAGLDWVSFKLEAKPTKFNFPEEGEVDDAFFGNLRDDAPELSERLGVLATPI
jgi:hypothetical protein